jgi:hypothetical protein
VESIFTCLQLTLLSIEFLCLHLDYHWGSFLLFGKFFLSSSSCFFCLTTFFNYLVIILLAFLFNNDVFGFNQWLLQLVIFLKAVKGLHELDILVNPGNILLIEYLITFKYLGHLLELGASVNSHLFVEFWEKKSPYFFISEQWTHIRLLAICLHLFTNFLWILTGLHYSTLSDLCIIYN